VHNFLHFPLAFTLALLTFIVTLLIFAVISRPELSPAHAALTRGFELSGVLTVPSFTPSQLPTVFGPLPSTIPLTSACPAATGGLLPLQLSAA